MIVRILGEGQYRVDDAELDALNALDAVVEQAAAEGDEAALAVALQALLDHVRLRGAELEADALVESDLILPDAEADVAQIRAWMDDSDVDAGLIPG